MALIPAGGRATRLGDLPCSKEIVPLRFGGGGAPPGGGPILACDGLLGALRQAGVERAVFALGAGKWDVPSALGCGGGPRRPALSYVPVTDSRSVPESLDRAYPFVADRVVVMGFPDVWFRPVDAVRRTLDAHARTGADVALGCFPTDRPERTDMVAIGDRGEVRRIEVRNPASSLRFNWLLAAWGPRFSAFLHEQVATSAGGGETGEPRRGEPRPGPELQLGEVFRRALDAGLAFTAAAFEDGDFVDLGTPGDLGTAWRRGWVVAPEEAAQPARRARKNPSNSG